MCACLWRTWLRESYASLRRHLSCFHGRPSRTLLEEEAVASCRAVPLRLQVNNNPPFAILVASRVHAGGDDGSGTRAMRVAVRVIALNPAAPPFLLVSTPFSGSEGRA